MDLVVIQAMTEVKLEGLPDDGLHLDEDCVIHPVNEAVLTPAETFFRSFIGDLHAKLIREAHAANFLLHVSEEPVGALAQEAFLRRSMAWSQLFLFSLWLVKDHSGNTGDGHLLVVESEKDPHIISIQPGVLNWTADCARRPTAFSKVEVEEAALLFTALQKLAPSGILDTTAPRPSGLVFDSRLVRSLYFAQAARASAEIGIKLAFQCLCFESLFASSSDSISHRVSERAAVIAIRSGEERRTVYREIRDLYAARSTVVHGDPLKESALPKYREVATRADGHLRTSLRGIVEDSTLLTLFSGKKAGPVDDYFLTQLFPGDP